MHRALGGDKPLESLDELVKFLPCVVKRNRHSDGSFRKSQGFQYPIGAQGSRADHSVVVIHGFLPEASPPVRLPDQTVMLGSPA
jgi:hypothetical protein